MMITSGMLALHRQERHLIHGGPREYLVKMKFLKRITSLDKILFRRLVAEVMTVFILAIRTGKPLVSINFPLYPGLTEGFV